MKDPGKAYLPVLTVLFLLSVACYVQEQDTLPASLTEPKLAGEWYYPEAGYAGTQLFRGSWFPGRVLLENGRKSDDKMLAYNGLQDQLIWLDKKGGKVLALDKGLVAGFVLQDEQGKEMYFRKIRVKPLLMNDSVSVFVQVLWRGQHLSLFVHRKIISDYTETYDGFVTPQNGKLLKSAPVYYIMAHGRQQSQIEKINRKMLYAIFPEKKKDIRKILHKNHLSLHHEYQLIKAIELIDEMEQ